MSSEENLKQDPASRTQRTQLRVPAQVTPRPPLRLLLRLLLRPAPARDPTTIHPMAGSSAGLRRVFARSFAAGPWGLSASLGVSRRLSPVFRRSFAAPRVFPRGLRRPALC